MLTEEQLREIEAERHHAAMGRWVPQLLAMGSFQTEVPR